MTTDAKERIFDGKYFCSTAFCFATSNVLPIQWLNEVSISLLNVQYRIYIFRWLVLGRLVIYEKEFNHPGVRIRL